tara:strand:+ start:595 stop:894 length:300 start_codon:yes stop_codon:yes gene_type:complete
MSIPSFNITYKETDDGTELIVDDLKGFYNALLSFVVNGYYTKFETTLFCEFIDKDGNIYKSDVDEYNLDKTLDKCLDYFEREEEYEKCITIKKMINERL